MVYIYLIQHLESGKVYIGQTISTYKRFSAHRTALKYGEHRNPYLQSAWTKYGKEAFVFFELASLSSREEADEAECFYISWFKALSLSYNINPGGSTREMSPEGRRRMVEKLRGRTHTLESRQRISGGQKGRVHSEETKKKIGLRSRQKVMSPESRAKIAEANRGKSLSEGTKKLLSESISKAKKGKPASAKQKASLTRYYETHIPGSAKLSPEDVLNLRALYSEGKLTQFEVAQRFNISPSIASQVIRGRTWGKLKLEPMDTSKSKVHKRPSTKLSESSVLEIRSLYDAGQTSQNELSAQFNVSQACISRILSRKTWSTVS